MPELVQTRFRKALSGVLDVTNVRRIAAETLKRERRVVVSGLSGSSRALLIAVLWQVLKRPIILLAASDAATENLRVDVGYFHGELNDRPAEAVCSFPALETDPYSGLTPHADTQQARAGTLWRLRKGAADIVVTSVQALGGRLGPAARFDSYGLRIKVGDEVSYELMLEHLLTAGYLKQEPVSSVGEFSQRGGIVDVFSPLMANPVRIEFFGDTVDSIREFDLDDQRSRNPIRRVDILPMREHFITREMYRNWASVARQHWFDDRYQRDLDDKLIFAADGEPFSGSAFLIPEFYPLEAVLTDYVEGAVFVLDEPDLLKEAYGKFFAVLEQRYAQARKAAVIALAPEKLFFPPEDMGVLIAQHPSLNLEELTSDGSAFLIVGQPAIRFHGRIREMVDTIRQSFKAGTQVVLLGSTLGIGERLRDILHEYDLPFRTQFGKQPINVQEEGNAPVVAIGRISAGFRLPEVALEVFAETDIFDETEYFSAPRRHKTTSSFMADLQDLKEGHYVVHVDHGIGLYEGITTIHNRECMALNYHEGDRLYVPLERLDLVQKYSVAEDTKPNLDKLGGTTWVTRKARVKRAIQEMAQELLQLYAQRKVVLGHSFSPDDEWQQEFEEAFQYEETLDQLTAITDIKKDMESQAPMDRLVCGDVGYGKTEVGMRAAFKAISGNKQVAMLAPTTVLCLQHYQTLKERFAAFPVNVAMLSRFVPNKEQKRVIRDIESRKVDIVVGTHRLLSKDIEFYDLGLLIIDEEQRFGVTHKERLKQLKQQVDVVTMTATPIPRTLHMALSGLRDMSVIETPPRDRLAINTAVVKFDPTVIQNAIDFELDRGGQVYFVHNRVQSIYSLASFVQRTCPRARVGVAHGQMGEKELERIMVRFMDHQFDVLVSTTIIENGLDIPAANTMLVNRADRYGLAQLYQLRGRVGRSNRRAFAYLLIPSDKRLTPVARRRLAAIREFSELGAGFRIAALDLELRGAGNVLGGQQHGHIEAIGFDLYCQMLERAIEELRTGESPPDVDTSINLQADLKLPSGFVSDETLRLRIYKNVASLRTEEEIEEQYRELEDRFGELPRQVHNLLEYARLRVFGRSLGIDSIDRKRDSIDIVFHEKTRVNPDQIVKLVEERQEIMLVPPTTLRIKTVGVRPEFFENIQDVLRGLS